MKKPSRVFLMIEVEAAEKQRIRDIARLADSSISAVVRKALNQTGILNDPHAPTTNSAHG